MGPDCTLGPKEQPLPEACRNVTLANALKAKAAFRKKQNTTIVAAVFGEDSEDSDISLGDDKTEKYVPHNFSLSNHLWWHAALMPQLPAHQLQYELSLTMVPPQC